ncbi:MAG: type II toxin-antitoxin system VapB family antitoxin [Opitutales bacterium]
MKTTLDIPEKLLADVMKATKAKTKREAVLRALEDVDRRSRLRDLAERLGSSDTFMDYGELMTLREKELPKGGESSPLQEKTALKKPVRNRQRSR